MDSTSGDGDADGDGHHLSDSEQAPQQYGAGDTIESHVSKVRSVLRQLTREWSSAGAAEREQCFAPLLNAVENAFPRADSRHNVRVLVPGAGLGRLPWEFARRGFSVQGNEFSYYQLLTSNYILNHTSANGSREPSTLRRHTIYPEVHQTNNIVREEDQFLAMNIPDVDISNLPDAARAELSMIAGEFVEVYQSQIEQWDCVCTCFFIDTAHNVVQYLRTIAGVLRPGGVWVNLGPLLYHYADMYTEPSIELTLEEVLRVAERLQLPVSAPPTFLRCGYTSNARSMQRTEYHCPFFTAVKQPPVTSTGGQAPPTCESESENGLEITVTADDHDGGR